MCHIDLKQGLEIYHWALSANQSFNMCNYDSARLAEGKKMGYVIDGYDLSRFIFPKEFFKGKNNPHHESMCRSWETFFKESNPDISFALISPFAILETYSSIRDNLYSGSEFQSQFSINQNKSDILSKIINGEINELNEEEITQEETLESLYLLMQQIKNAHDIILKGEWFDKLSLLQSSNQVKILDVMLNKIDGVEEDKLLDYNLVNINRGISYLSNKRGNMFSDYTKFYNTLDVYHYVLVENIKKYFQLDEIDLFLTSSGILSRNSWLLTKYGKFPEDTYTVPADWSARNGNVPAYLFKCYNHFNKDISQVGEFFDEGATIAKVILKELEKIPEIKACNESAMERAKYKQINPKISINNKVAQFMLLFDEEYFKIVKEDHQTGKIISLPDDIDIQALLEWFSDKTKRNEEKRKAIETVQKKLNNLNINPIKWESYIAPLGDTAYDILKEFNQNIDT
jgi:hypothetical protein